MALRGNFPLRQERVSAPSPPKLELIVNQSNQVVVKLAQAYHFAASRHVDHRRKGESAEPYMNHLTEVAELAAAASGGNDPAIVIAAVLHDTVEDTATTFAELEQRFGADVVGLVAEVTDDKSLPKQVRKDLQVEHAAHASPRAQIIKMADKISNLRSLAASPPAGWSDQRIAEYGAWAARVVDPCKGASTELARLFEIALADLTTG